MNLIRYLSINKNMLYRPFSNTTNKIIIVKSKKEITIKEEKENIIFDKKNIKEWLDEPLHIPSSENSLPHPWENEV